MLRGRAIQRGDQLGDRRVVGALVRALLSRRRHLTRAQFSDNELPGVGVAGRVLVADAVEIQSAFLDLAVVATDAIVIHDLSHWRVSPDRWMRGLLLRPDGMPG